MQVQQFYDYTDMLKANLQSAITIGGKLQFKDDKQYQEFLDAGLIIGSLLVNSESANVYNTSDNTIWNAVEAKVTLWGGNPQTDMNLRHLALVEVLEPLSAPDDILVQIEKVRVVAKFDVVDEETIQFGDQVYVQADPYTKNLIDNWEGTKKVYRLFVDPINGNDLNDGLTWAKAIKTVRNVQNIIPSDLEGRICYVICSSGNVGEFHSSVSNGIIEFRFACTVHNTDSAYNNFISNNGERTFDSDEPVIFEGDGMEALKHSGKNLELLFIAEDDELKSLWGKFVFRIKEGTTAPQVIANFQRIFSWNIVVDMSNATTYGLNAVTGSNTTIYSGEFIGGAGASATRTGAYSGALTNWIEDGGNFAIGEAGSYLASKWRVGYAPAELKSWIFRNIKSIYSNQETESKGCKLNLESLHIDNATSGYTSSIYLSTKFSGYVKYNESEVTLADTSVSPRTIVQSVSGLTKQYLSSKLKDVGGIVMNIKTAVPDDSDLSNKDFVFYMDEATDTLKVKYKDSGGVVQTGDIAILT